MVRRIALAVSLAMPGQALAQHVVRPKDAEAPIAVPAQPAEPAPEPLVNTPGARKNTVHLFEDEKRPDAGPPQKFKDDIDDASAGPAAAARTMDCSHGGCELILTKKFESTAFTLHVRPATPKAGRVVEVVVEAFQMMDPPDPEFGDRKPVTGEELVAHVEGVGRFLMHPIARNAGAYGFHFTPAGNGARSIEVSRLDGRPGLQVSFEVPVGQAPGKTAELRDWRPPGPADFKSQAVAGAPSPSEDE